MGLTTSFSAKVFPATRERFSRQVLGMSEAIWESRCDSSDDPTRMKLFTPFLLSAPAVLCKMSWAVRGAASGLNTDGGNAERKIGA